MPKIKTSKKSVTKTVKSKVTKKPKTVKKPRVSKNSPVLDTTPVATTPAPSPVAPLPPVKPESQKIWEEIQFLPIEMFALPGQVVGQHCAPIDNYYLVDPDRLFMTIRSSATLPSLEASLDSYTSTLRTQAAELKKRGITVDVRQYNVEMVDKWVIVSRAVQLVGNGPPAYLFKK